MFTKRQILILYYLLHQEYCDAATFESNLHIAHRTLLSEIADLNAVFKRQRLPWEIKNKRSKGYYLLYPLEMVDTIELYKRQTYAYKHLYVHEQFDENERISWIIRHLLYTNDWIKIESLSDLLCVSPNTLTKDLKIVRETLSTYGLSIQSLPYYGMKVIGNEMTIRNCMIDFSDIYSFTEDSLFPEHAKKQYNITDEMILTTRVRVYSLCETHHIVLSERGFTRVCFYLLLIEQRANSVDMPPITVDKMQQLVRVPLYHVAQHLLQEKRSPNEIVGLLIMLLVNQDPNNITEENQSALRVLVPDIEQKVDFLLKKVSCVPLLFSQPHDFFTSFYILITKYLARQAFHIIERDVTTQIKNQVANFFASTSLALLVCQLLEDSDDVLQMYYFYEGALTFYSQSYKYKNEYKQTNIILATDVGYSLFDIVQTRLNLKGFNAVFHHRYFYELQYLDYKAFDFLFLSKKHAIDKLQFPIPVFEYEHFLDRHDTTEIWSEIFIKRRKRNEISQAIAQYHFSDVQFTSTRLVDDLLTYFQKQHITFFQHSEETIRSYIRQLIFSMSTPQFSTSFIACLFVRNAPEHIYQIFTLDSPLQYDSHRITSIHLLFLEPSDSPIQIKNADSEMRRLIKNVNNI